MASSTGDYVAEEILAATDHFILLPDDVSFLSLIYANASNLPCPSARQKHSAYLEHYSRRSKLVKALIDGNFKLTIINDEYDWEQ